MIDLAGWGMPLPLAGRTELLMPGGDRADREAVLAEADAVLGLVEARIAAADAMDARRAEASADWPPRATLEHDRDLVRLLAGRERLPVLVGVSAPDPDLETSFAHPRVADATVARGWLDQIGHVRAAAGAFSSVLDLAEALADGPVADLEVAQLPHIEADTWIAVTGLSEVEPGPRVSWLAHRFSGADLGGPVAGLVVDRFVETLPGKAVTTGLGFHFDAPTNRAPQAVLLLAPRPDHAWDLDEMVEAVRQTFDLTRLRAVGPEHLAALDQYLPAVYLDESTDPGTTGGLP
jgi:hypothetical protein